MNEYLMEEKQLYKGSLPIGLLNPLATKSWIYKTIYKKNKKK